MDLTLRMLGDAAGAKQAFGELGTAVTVAGGLIKDFVANSVKQYAEGERAYRQLKSAAGQYTEALSEQAEVMKAKYAVDDDQIRHIETLALRYGAAPGQIQKATEAVLNFSAATGKDATAAMEQLVRGVEAGGGSLGKLGVHFKSTGDFVKDFDAAAEAMGKKFAGAGEADASSLAGRMRKVQIATDDFHKAVGGFFATIEAKTGVVEGLAKAINDVNDAVQKKGFKGALKTFAKGGDTYEDRLRHSIPSEFQTGDDWESRLARARSADQQSAGLIGHLKSVGAIPSDAGYAPEALPMTSEGDHAVGGGGSKKDAELRRIQEAAALEEMLRQQEEYQKRSIKSEEEFELHQEKLRQDAATKTADESSNELQEMLKKEVEFEQNGLEKLAEAEDKANKLRVAAQEKYDAEQQRKWEQQTRQWEHAGDQMGAALVNAISAQLERLSEGGDVDVGEMTGSIVETALTILGGVIGTIYGAPQLGGAIGGLAGKLAHTGISQAFKKHHDGGWVERFHEGGWPGGLASDERVAVLQTGERVLSRQQVANAGGPSAVDAMARGGGRSTVVNISAMDTQSIAESFGGGAGRGVYNAIRVGRGDLVPLFRS